LDSAGRSEVSIGGISTKKLNYSLKTIQPLSELNANSKELTFIQAFVNGLVFNACGHFITQLVGIV
jgi:hypothetical protein